MKRNYKELKDCQAFYQWAQYNPMVAAYLIKNTNEGKRSLIGGKILKSIGLRAGIPDYHLPIPNNRYIGLWIEMKTEDERNRAKRKNQNEWIEKLNKMGHYATYSYGWHDAVKITTDYLNNKL